jgi:hypothetical protein
VKKELRTRLAGYLLQREIKSHVRHPKIVPFGQARHIGIIYDATKDSDYELVKNYVREMMKDAREVVALGYVNLKEIPQNRYMKLGLDFFTRKSLNWKMKPRNSIVSSFLQREFDILICLNSEPSVPIRYVTALANARCKIGKYESSGPSVFDVMVKIEHQTGLKPLIEQVDHYMKMISNEKQ